MAKNTSVALRNKMIYSIFPRNYTDNGGFNAIKNDLSRIKDLGTDIVWLMPIYPVGQKNRKGSLGSPYAISDYRAINPELGTMSDFVELCNAIHDQGMKVIIDIVYNHTSPDSELLSAHPDWFYHHSDGSLGNRVADWSDIIDLDYQNHDLWQYQIDTLKKWAQYVDGFRCDVAPLVPLDFWLNARESLEEYKPGLIWLAESNDPEFIKHVRDAGFDDLSDSELYQAFDMVYDYDVLDDLHATVAGNRSLGEFSRILQRQDIIYPKNYVKMRFLENHDVPRAADYISGDRALRNMLAFSLFEKGSSLIYAGEEFGNEHTPSLFDKDPVQLSGRYDFSDLIKGMMDLKHGQADLFTKGAYDVVDTNDNVVQLSYKYHDHQIVGYFAIHPFKGTIKVNMENGLYENCLTNSAINVENHELVFDGEPVIIIS